MLRPQLQPLDYYSPSAAPMELNRHYLTTAVACGSAPLTAAVFIFLMWLATRSQGLALVSAWIMVIGAGLSIAGFIALLLHIITNWACLTRGPQRWPNWKAILLTALLLISTIPICALVILLAATQSAPMFG